MEDGCSHLYLIVPSAAVVAHALLRTDLGILLDGDVFVGLERGDGVVGDLSTSFDC
jgi:hypothetical protein